MDTDDGSVPLKKRGGWKSVRLNVGAPGSSHEVNLERVSRIQQVSKTLKDLNAFSKRQPAVSTHADPKGLEFSISEQRDLNTQFDNLIKDDNGLLRRSQFGICIGMDENSNDFAGNLFDSLCRRRNITGNGINKEQFEEFCAEIANQSFDSRLQIYLDMIDKDKDGRITKDEMREIIEASASANKLSPIKTDADLYATLIMEELDKDKFGYIQIGTLEKLLRDAAKHNERGETQHLSELSKQSKLMHFLRDNWKKCWVVVLWIGIMVGLFTWKYIQYKDRAVYDVMGPCVCIAKGAAETLKLNMAIMLLPVCRNTITWLRNKTKLGVVVPFDDNINFHQVIAVAIAIGVGLHAITHLACDFPRLIHATEEEYKPMQQYFGDQPQNYWHFMKEVEGYSGIIMIVLMTIAFTLAWLRKGLELPSFSNKLTRFNPFKNSKLFGAIGTKLKPIVTYLNKVTGFNVFWYSHHLLVIVYALLIVHGIKLYLTKEWYKKTTWMYLAVPILLYACERLIRTFRSRVIDPTSVLKVISYPTVPRGVLALRMKKPKNFKFKSGEYIFIKCAAVSPFEWHPFSITSAPSDDYLSVHIREGGDWTEKINQIFRDPKATGIFRADYPDESPLVPKVTIDGPYGAPAQDYKNFEVVLLVGSGIGATPMISIVKDIVNNMKAKEEQEHALENGLQKNNPSPTRARDFRTKRAYFYWVTKEQESFAWFKDDMNEVAEKCKNGVIEIHNHCTSVFKEDDARSTLITMLQSLYHAKKGVDVVSGTRVKSHFARPDWHDVYKRIAENHKGSRIGVFICGSPGLAKDHKKFASDFSDPSTSTSFVFHKENF